MLKAGLFPVDRPLQNGLHEGEWLYVFAFIDAVRTIRTDGETNGSPSVRGVFNHAAKKP